MQKFNFNLFGILRFTFGNIFAKNIVFAFIPFIIFPAGLLGFTHELQAVGTGKVTSFETMANELIQGIEKIVL